MLLGVNIDHIATLRQARYASMLDSPNAEPSVLAAASAALRGGADSLTIHVRGDRRHMQDADAFRVRKEIPLPLNLEMGNTEEMLNLALRLAPDYVCMVPEKREEITTEGGLDVVRHFDELVPTVQELTSAGIIVSMFIDPDEEQVRATARLFAGLSLSGQPAEKTPVVELHTGCYANALTRSDCDAELARLRQAACCAHDLGVRVNAGHGINYSNLADLAAAVPYLHELNIGHTIVAHALSVGMEHAVSQMKQLILRCS